MSKNLLLDIPIGEQIKQCVTKNISVNGFDMVDYILNCNRFYKVIIQTNHQNYTL